MKNNKKTEQCFCKSYYDDNNVLRDCTCGSSLFEGSRFEGSRQDSKTHHRIIKSFIHSTLKQVFDEAVGEKRKIYKSGEFLDHRSEFNEGYNEKRQELINLRKKYGV